MVDDNGHMGRIVQDMFRGFGVGVVEVHSDAAAGLRACDDCAFDLIVIDYHMPTIDGLDFTRLVRKSASSKNALTPIVMVSAYTEHWRVAAARDAGVTEVCAKPLSAKELWTKFASIVNSPRAFVRAGEFFGPDRRRKTEPREGPERRRDVQYVQGEKA